MKEFDYMKHQYNTPSKNIVVRKLAMRFDHMEITANNYTCTCAILMACERLVHFMKMNKHTIRNLTQSW